MIGRSSGREPLAAAGELAAKIGGSRRWNIIGQLATLAVFLVGSYYAMIAGWVIAYAWKSIRGDLVGLGRTAVQAEWQTFLSNPWRLMGWQLLFLLTTALISARGIGRGIELASRIRAPALLALLIVLDGYALYCGDVAKAMRFAFGFHWEALSAGVVLAAIGQAFFATGVGLGMMLAYGSYMSRSASLVRSALAVCGSILLASLLATLLVFPMVFRFHMDPAGGPALVFDVMPSVFAGMPAGRAVGTVFFVLLILAALTPMLAAFEPVVAWLVARGWTRRTAAAATGVATWLVGLGSVLSFNTLASWHPFEAVPLLAGKTLFEDIDFIAGNVLTPMGALFTCLFTGWRLDRATFATELGAINPFARRVCRLMLRYVAPAAIIIVLGAAFLPNFD